MKTGKRRTKLKSWEMPNRTEECECGRAKGLKDEACSVCSFLDQVEARSTSTDIEIVWALRMNPYLTLEELASSVGACTMTIHRRVHVLMKRGRLARIPDDQDVPHNKSTAARWLYTLTDRVGRAASQLPA